MGGIKPEMRATLAPLDTIVEEHGARLNWVFIFVFGS